MSSATKVYANKLFVIWTCTECALLTIFLAWQVVWTFFTKVNYTASYTDTHIFVYIVQILCATKKCQPWQFVVGNVIKQNFFFRYFRSSSKFVPDRNISSKCYKCRFLLRHNSIMSSNHSDWMCFFLCSLFACCLLSSWLSSSLPLSWTNRTDKSHQTLMPMWKQYEVIR